MRAGCVVMLALMTVRRAAGAFGSSPRLVTSAVAAARGLPTRMMSAEAVAAVPAVTLDERLVADDPELIKRMLKMRRAGEEQLAAVDRIGELTRARSEAVIQGNDAREVRKKLSPKIGALMKSGDAEAAEALKAEVAAAAATASEADGRLEALDTERNALFQTLPNLLDERTPDGDDEDANTEVSSWGVEGVELPSERMWHDEFGAALGGIDTERASRLSGSRFSVLKGGLARLERALINFFLDTHTGEHGYTEVMVPYLVGRDALYGTGQLPKFEEDLFKLSEPLNGRDGFLIPTAEVKTLPLSPKPLSPHTLSPAHPQPLRPRTLSLNPPTPPASWPARPWL